MRFRTAVRLLPRSLRSALFALSTFAPMWTLFAAARLPAQTPQIPSGSSEAQIKTEAETEGAAFTRLSTGASADAAPRVCVTAFEVGPARSGEFTIGGNLAGLSGMYAGHQGKVWWAPLHNARNMPPLVVRGRSLTTPQDTVRFTSSNVAFPVVHGAPPVPEAERKYFFPSGITIPQRGRWLVIATSGPNWGCFILTVQ
jgi:hypothetical protein